MSYGSFLINKECPVFQEHYWRNWNLKVQFFQSTDNYYWGKDTSSEGVFVKFEFVLVYVQILIQGSLKTYRHENQWMKLWSAYSKKLVI